MGAAAVFDKMEAQPDPVKKARAHRSRAFLEMYRGRYDLAIGELRQAIVIDGTLGATISEFRDRLILTRALDAKGMAREASAELAAVDRLIARLSLGAEWLRIPATIHARRGDPGGTAARRSMTKTIGAFDSRLDDERNIAQDEAHVGHARGELARAEGRHADAISILEAARVGRFEPHIVEALAAAQLRHGKSRRGRKELRRGPRQ